MLSFCKNNIHCLITDKKRLKKERQRIETERDENKTDKRKVKPFN